MKINPFSPDKVLCYYDNWKIAYLWYKTKGAVNLPYPITTSTDLSARCNMKCKGCNAHEVLSNNKTELDEAYLTRLAEVLAEFGVQGNCLGGGGDSTMNPHLGGFVKEMKNRGVGVGMVTNGILLDKVENVELFDWIGVSVDAAYAKTWAEVHQVSPRLFSKVLDNMADAALNGVQVTYKYLIRPENVGEIHQAAAEAHELGLFAFHARPMADPWFSSPSKRLFTDEQVETAKSQLILAKKHFNDDNFQVHGVLSKVGDNFEVVHPFKKCWSIFATCVFQSNKKVGLCCDLRGCPIVEVGPFEDPRDFFTEFWGSPEHRAIQDKVDVNKCSRCTFTTLNQLFEQGIMNDGFMIDFI